MVADDIKDSLIAQSGRIMVLDSLTIVSLRQQVATLMRNEERWNQLAGNKDSQLKQYADMEKELRKQVRRARLGKFVAYVLAAGAGVLAILK